MKSPLPLLPSGPGGVHGTVIVWDPANENVYAKAAFEASFSLKFSRISGPKERCVRHMATQVWELPRVKHLISVMKFEPAELVFQLGK